MKKAFSRLMREFWWMNLIGAVASAFAALMPSNYLLADVDWILCGINLTLFAVGKRYFESAKRMDDIRLGLEQQLTQVGYLVSDLNEAKTRTQLWRRDAPPAPPTRH